MATPNYLFILRLRFIFFSVVASLVFLFKLMLKNLAITATLNQRILLKAATLNYFFVLRLRRTIILCGSYAESENFHIAATPFLPLVLRLRRTRIYLLLDLIQIPATPLLSSPVGCRMISSMATPKVLSPSASCCTLRTHVALDTSPTPKMGLKPAMPQSLRFVSLRSNGRLVQVGKPPLKNPPSQCPDIFSTYGESQAV